MYKYNHFKKLGETENQINKQLKQSYEAKNRSLHFKAW